MCPSMAYPLKLLISMLPLIFNSGLKRGRCHAGNLDGRSWILANAAWKLKLSIIEGARFFTTALDHVSKHLWYIDAFAG